jgi:hypothetical protein
MVVAGWQAEENQDYDPNTEAQTSGLVLGINTHSDGSKTAIPVVIGVGLGPAYTGICTVLRAVVAEITDRERYTVVHEVGHTLGLPHTIMNPGDPPVDTMDPYGDGQTLPFKADNLRRLREYNGP